MTPQDLLDSLTAPTWETVGFSVCGLPLRVRRFGQGSPTILMKGAIHGNEPLGAFLIKRLAAELELTPPACTVWLWPVVNPDGFLVGRKHNERGVDLNRNFPSANWSAEHRPDYFPGAFAGSERETAAVVAFIAKIGATRLISLHSPFRTVNYDGPAAELAERMGKLNGYGHSADIGYPTPGSFGSLYGVDQGLPVITLEIPKIDEEQAWSENRLALYESLNQV